jgi:4-hydroxyphenylacetate 3-monooxygenase
MLSEIMVSVETVKACLVASETRPVPTPFGTVAPDPMPLWVIRLNFPKMFHRMQEIVQLLGASGIVGVPSYAELAGQASEVVKEYCQSVHADADERIRLCRLAFDASISAFAGRQQLYERYWTGDPVRLAGALCDTYPRKDEMTHRITTFLDDLRERSYESR